METFKLLIATFKLFDGNGVDVSVAQFARELSKRHTVRLIAAYAGMEPGVDMRLYPAGNPLRLPGIAKELDKERFDYISTHFPPFDLVASFMKTPHMLHDPGVPPARILGVKGNMKFLASVNMSRMISCRGAAMVLPVSEFMASVFKKKYFYSGPMRPLPHGIEFPDDDIEPIEGYGRYALYVGRHTPYKRIETLLDIFAEAKKRIPEKVSLVTIGIADKGYGERLKAKAERVGDVHMLGFVKNIWPYYAGASVYATCSAWEMLDRPALEAQYMGKPVIAFDTCSHPEVIMHGRAVRDNEAFADALVEYLSGDYTDESVRERVVRKYSVESMAEGFISAVRSL